MEQVRAGERRTRDLSWGDARARALMHALARDAATRDRLPRLRDRGRPAQGPAGVRRDLRRPDQRRGAPRHRVPPVRHAGRVRRRRALRALHLDPGGELSDASRATSSTASSSSPTSRSRASPATGTRWTCSSPRSLDERGDLRALLYLDVPSDLQAPRQGAAARDLRRAGDDAALDRHRRSSARSTPTTCGSSARPAAWRGPTRRATTSGTSLREARTTLLGALSVDELEIHVFLDQDAETPRQPGPRRWRPTCAARSTTPRRGRGTDQRVLIIEPGHVWGDAELDAAYADWFTDALRAAGFEAVVVAPVGVDDEVLGMLMCARRTGSRRWTDGEGVAALELGPRPRAARSPTRTPPSASGGCSRSCASSRRLAPPLPARAHPRDQQPDDGDRRQRRVPRARASSPTSATSAVRRPSCAAASASATCSRASRCSRGSATRSTRRRCSTSTCVPIVEETLRLDDGRRRAGAASPSTSSATPARPSCSPTRGRSRAR